ncbi:MAG: helix-turn-helix domain-containing protein [Beijerinckiaceae bacterium]|nr:helix-turn-helix domain-containing protein [Beijerinckiaceae bacterium]
MPEKDRLDYWQHVLGELIGGFELREYDSRNFSSRFAVSAMGDLKFGHFTGVSQTIDRKPQLIKRTDTDDYIVLLESSKLFNIEQNGRQHSGRDSMVLIDITRPYHASHPEEMDVIDVFIPRRVMERALGPARQAAGLSIDSSQPSFPVIMSFLRSLAQHGSSLDPAAAARMSAFAVDLIASAFAEKLGQDPSRNVGGAVILYRAQAYIAEHLGVSGLGISEVASQVGISVRRLHQIAADEGISLVDWMWERRLERARSMLIDPAHITTSVGSIAYQCGFVDQAHFSRRFRQRFGLAPSDWRASGAPARGGLKPPSRP